MRLFLPIGAVLRTIPIVLLLVTASGPRAQTTLNAGDLVIVGVNTDIPDQFRFIPLVDLDAGTEIRFTDNGVHSDGSFRANEGAVKYTAPGPVSAGTNMLYDASAPSSAWATDNDSGVGTSGFFLSTSGDQVIAFQGASATPSFIFAVQTNSTVWQADATSSNDSALPPGLTNGGTAVAVGTGSGAGDEFDNSTYNGSVTSGDAATLRAAVANNTNWNGDHTFIDLLFNGSFSVTGGGGGPVISVTPSSHDYGSLTVGSSVSQAYTVANTGDATLSIGTLGLSGSDVGEFAIGTESCNAAVLAPTATCSIQITFDPSTAGAFSASLDLPSDAVTGPNVVALSGTGVAPLSISRIHDIQGSGTVTPIPQGQTVMVEAIVVGDFQANDADTQRTLNGFFLQEEDGHADSDAATSEGIFVFDGSSLSVDVNEGDLVQVTGTVTEFFGETQITSSTATVLSSGNPLPTAAPLTFPVVGTMINSDGALIADLERYEGMRVTIPQELTVADLYTLGRFGDIGLYAAGRLPTFTQGNAPSVTGFQVYEELAVRNTVILDDGSTVQSPSSIPFEIASAPGDVAGELDANDQLRAGDTITGLTGVLRFSRGSGAAGDEIYRVMPTETPTFVNMNPRPASAPAVGGALKVASFNVLNFFTALDDGSTVAGPAGLEPRGANDLSEFDRQVGKLVAALVELDADVVGLIELENEFQTDQNADGLVAIDYLVAQLNQALMATGTTYATVDPGRGFIDAGDAISVGLIYQTHSITVAPGTTVAILDDTTVATLGLNFGHELFDGDGTNRASLAATFEEIATGEIFTVAVNHFKSKGSVSPFGNNAGIGNGVGNNNEARTQAATAVDEWLDSDPTSSGDPDFLIIGDLNAYAKEDPIRLLIDAGYQDQIARFLAPGKQAYSYAFPLDLVTGPQVQGYGTLDYALASPTLAVQVTDAAEWHINSDEASVFDYNLEFKPQAQADGLYAANPFRASDHDPLIMGLNLGLAPVYGDLDGDGCIGRNDVVILLNLVRVGTTDPATQDINGDGVVNRADVRALIQLYTDPSGICSPSR